MEKEKQSSGSRSKRRSQEVSGSSSSGPQVSRKRQHSSFTFLRGSTLLKSSCKAQQPQSGSLWPRNHWTTICGQQLKVPSVYDMHVWQSGAQIFQSLNVTVARQTRKKWFLPSSGRLSSSYKQCSQACICVLYALLYAFLEDFCYSSTKTHAVNKK